jgi:hypothetical protein
VSCASFLFPLYEVFPLYGIFLLIVAAQNGQHALCHQALTGAGVHVRRAREKTSQSCSTSTQAE